MASFSCFPDDANAAKRRVISHFVSCQVEKKRLFACLFDFFTYLCTTITNNFQHGRLSGGKIDFVGVGRQGICGSFRQEGFSLRQTSGGATNENILEL
jgi:hypothetical protein